MGVRNTKPNPSLFTKPRKGYLMLLPNGYYLWLCLSKHKHVFFFNHLNQFYGKN